MRPQQLFQVPGQDRDCAHVVDCLDGGRAHLAVEHRQLAEDLARPEVRERDRAPVGVLAHHPRRAGAQDVAGVARIPFAQDDRAGRIAARHRDASHLLELLRGQLGEEGHATQQLDRGLDRRSRRANHHLQEVSQRRGRNLGGNRNVRAALLGAQAAQQDAPADAASGEHRQKPPDLDQRGRVADRPPEPEQRVARLPVRERCPAWSLLADRAVYGRGVIRKLGVRRGNPGTPRVGARRGQRLVSMGRGN
jgi:hypothetical protein